MIAKSPLALLLLMAAAAAAQEGAGEKVRGFDLDKLALATAKATAFSTQYGSAEGEASFDGWLREQGLSLADYDAAYNTFLERFERDPSGRLEESYFAALDRYTPGERRPELGDPARDGLAREDEGTQIDAAYAADAWSAIDEALPGQTDAATQLAMIDKLLADSQARASSGFLAMQEAAAQKYAAQFESFRKGQLPGSGDAAEPAAAPPPAAPTPEPGSIGALHTALLSPLAEKRRAAARAYAWECDSLALVPAAERDQDPRAPLCAPVALYSLWLPVAKEIFEAAPQAELHRVAPLLDYLRGFDLEADARQGLEALRRRLRQAELEAVAELAEERSEPERILLKKRGAELRDALAAVERALRL